MSAGEVALTPLNVELRPDRGDAAAFDRDVDKRIGRARVGQPGVAEDEIHR